MTMVEGRPASSAPAAPPLPQRSRAAATRGWYADPAGCHEFRFWNGLQWTPGVADNGFVREDPLPATPCAPPTDERVRPPLRAAGIGIAGLVLGGLVMIGVVLAFKAWAPEHKALALGLSEAGLWIGLLGAVIVVSRRYGSGSVVQDYGFRFRWNDLGWGLLLAFVARVLTAVIGVVVLLASGRLHSGRSASGLGTGALDTSVLVVLCVALVVGAPLVEELFFRGLMLRSLQTRVATPVAVGAQAVLFSACHALTTSGIGLITELLSTLMFGLLAGAVVVRFRRLGPTMVAHAFFNAVVAVVLIVVST
jgi:membrane protease YdiL (CAAX protease family)